MNEPIEIPVPAYNPDGPPPPSNESEIPVTEE
jgi:hypothetical protein